jgi:hypothetical protein
VSHDEHSYATNECSSIDFFSVDVRTLVAVYSFVVGIETICARLACLIDVAGLGLEELDGLAGLSPGHCGQVVRGTKSKLRASTTIAIASVFGVSAEYLTNGTGRSPATLSVHRAVTKARFAHAAKVAAMPAKTKRLGRP